MKVEESQADAERLSLLEATADEAATMLRVDRNQDPAKKIVEKINEAIVAICLGKPHPVAQDENADLLLGSLWGAQLVRQFGWHWADVLIDDEYPEVAVIAPDRSRVVFPLAFTQACLECHCISTVALAFNMMLEDKRMDSPKAGAYDNIMMHIHHLIPPYFLEDTVKHRA
ncbi:MAG: hypothetical protein RL095_1434 [Verrucomicrobiota bacterium]|jgi:hypothetical protein